ncbi:MAG: hypothetical protein ACRC20_13185 [Segniliparus sp.]|uniref:hypothetical protein n=1 Tax=Segniliparus sp. TaxID=2804064 RepID=UPI003F2E9B36
MKTPLRGLAAAVMAALAEAVRSCGRATFTANGSDGERTWAHAVDSVEKTGLHQHGVYTDVPDWRCDESTLLRGRVLTQSSVCAYVDPGSAAEVLAQHEAADWLAGLLAARSR